MAGPRGPERRLVAMRGGPRAHARARSPHARAPPPRVRRALCASAPKANAPGASWGARLPPWRDGCCILVVAPKFGRLSSEFVLRFSLFLHVRRQITASLNVPYLSGMRYRLPRFPLGLVVDLIFQDRSASARQKEQRQHYGGLGCRDLGAPPSEHASSEEPQELTLVSVPSALKPIARTSAWASASKTISEIVTATNLAPLCAVAITSRSARLSASCSSVVARPVTAFMKRRPTSSEFLCV